MARIIQGISAGGEFGSVKASEVNHVDLFVRSGTFPTPVSFPFVIGRDLVGTLVAIGETAENFRSGDRV
ncbi:hypothetical protein CIK60_09335 [Brevibacterium aurantiacum]|nr:hypothetical protein CIK60_09335 [Brevibacterium aurantiacum]